MKALVKFLFVLLTGAAVALSYYRSGDVYAFWLRAYYVDYRRMNEKEMIGRAYELMKLRDASVFGDYTAKLILIFPHSDEAFLLRGIALLRSGDAEKGLTAIVASINGVKLPPFVLDETVAALHDHRYFGEIVSLMKGRQSLNAETSYYYGRALFETGQPGAALERLTLALGQGKGDASVHYHIALSHAGLGRKAQALASMKRAWELAPDDPAITRALVDQYRQAGMQGEAEMLVRKKKR